MTFRYTVTLVILTLLNVAPGQANDGGCTTQEYGEFLPLGTSTASIIKVVEGRAGKAGPPGPPGPGPIVNKIDIDGEIETKFRDVKRGLDENLGAMEKQLETVESNMTEVKRGLDEKLEVMERRLETAESKMKEFKRGLDEKLRAMEKQLETVKTNTTKVKKGLDGKLEAIGKRLETAESKIKKFKRVLDENLGAMEKQLETVESNTAEVKRGLDEKLEAMEKRLETSESKIKEVKRGLDEKLETMEKRLETAESKIKDDKRGLDEKLEAMEKRLETTESKMRGYKKPSGCDKVDKLDAKQWDQTGGLFDIYPTQVEYCDITTDGGRWTVIQRRMDGSENFYRGWNDYVDGFGKKDKEFWLGLEAIHQMTKGGNYELRVDMMDWEGNTAYAKYSTFLVGDGASKYRLSVTGYSGNAGDALDFQNGHKFTTIDADNDLRGEFNCAVKYKGAWWHNACHFSNLNGLYVKGGRPVAFGEGINWQHWKGYEYALKFTEMKLREKQ